MTTTSGLIRSGALLCLALGLAACAPRQVPPPAEPAPVTEPAPVWLDPKAP